MWTPDVYQGAPTPVTGFMTAIAKAGGFAALLRVFFSTFGTLRTDWQPLLWVLAILTLVLGAVLGLVQRDVKRMLAYSSINHAGFILVGLAAATSDGISGSVYYVFAYALIVMGSFAVITVVGGRGDRQHDLDSYRGLARRQPALALAFTVLLLGQTGVPFTTGFLAKFYVISAAVKAHSYALAIIAMLSAAIAAAFYLRVVFLMYGVRLPAGTGDDRGSLSLPITGDVPDALEPGGTPPGNVSLGPVHVPAATAVAIFVTVAVTVVFGIWPAPLVDFVKAAGFLF
jgi:NADH-quinone oxidoreductase subunit N